MSIEWSFCVSPVSVWGVNFPRTFVSLKEFISSKVRYSRGFLVPRARIELARQCDPAQDFKSYTSISHILNNYAYIRFCSGFRDNFLLRPIRLKMAFFGGPVSPVSVWKGRFFFI
jgi:hypothetical protein